ncbi:uncharacterized protein Dana_GF16882 [Drosophila ananassae]|uniref:Kazal-like domain-containing protein n=1 Tax=Drosophila ananassae TaxID=7217 RepID=B3LWU4_DROAN|nr:uncharacterized protein LOC6499675 isoform X2 [Drosophila ananassae]EDV42732.1 uncharacterized protein Dana_GF16882 [Drosophila ananassae]
MQSACTLGNKIILICVILELGIGIGIGVEAQLLISLTGPKKCHDVCPMGYRVVCALDVLDGCLRTFASSCVMRMYNCKYQKDYRIIADRACEFITNDELKRLEL